MTDWQAAHQRLCAALPVRTHLREEPADKRKLSMTGSAIEARKKRIVVLHREGWNAARIARNLGVSENAVGKALRKMGLK